MAKLELKPGSNAFVFVSSAPHTLEELATTLAFTISAEQPVHLGNRLSYQLWAIGDMRPATLRVLPSSQSTRDWYTRMGEPAGKTPVFYTANIDWRGPPTKFEWLPNAFILPEAELPVTGAVSQPDGTPEELKARVQTRKTDEVITAIGTPIGKVLTSAKKSLFNADFILRAVGASLIGWVIWRGLKRLTDD